MFQNFTNVGQGQGHNVKYIDMVKKTHTQFEGPVSNNAKVITKMSFCHIQVRVLFRTFRTVFYLNPK